MTTMHDIERWADSKGYIIHRQMGVFPFPDGRKIWIVRDTTGTVETPRIEENAKNITLTWPHDEIFEIYPRLPEAILAMGGTIRWAEDTATASHFAGIDLGLPELLRIEDVERLADATNHLGSNDWQRVLQTIRDAGGIPADKHTFVPNSHLADTCDVCGIEYDDHEAMAPSDDDGDLPF
jgi:hypothetical protein